MPKGPGVVQIIAGSGIALNPTSGVGPVIVAATGTAGPGRVLASRFLVAGTSVASTAGATSAEIWMIGGGGGGGGVTASAAGQSSVGGGGASGRFAYRRTTNIPATWNYTIGAAGAGGAAGNNPGAAGGNTTINDGTTTTTAPGGGGGSAVGLTLGGAVAAAPTNADFDAGSSPGWPGFVAVLTSAIGSMSGAGASSPWGGGGAPRIDSVALDTGAGNAATGHGAGGSGALDVNAGGAKAGGAGTAGAIWLREFS